MNMRDENINNLSLTPDYLEWLKEIKSKIRSAQIKAALSANSVLILFYWDLGENISKKLDETSWGAKVIDRLSKDLGSEFPDLQRFSRTNLYYVKKFYKFFRAFSDQEQIVPRVGGQIESSIVPRIGTQTIPPIVHHLGGQLPWSHIKIILDKLTDHKETLFYIAQTIENGWSRDVLALQIKSNLFARQGKAITNFEHTLPSPQSDLAQQTIKDPYTFDFLTMTQPYNERDIENQFALRDINKPMGVSEFTLTEILPEELKGSLPTVEEIEADIGQMEDDQ